MHLNFGDLRTLEVSKRWIPKLHLHKAWVDGWNPGNSPVGVGNLSVYPVFFFFRVSYIPGSCLGFSEPATVVQLETRELDVCILYNYLGWFWVPKRRTLPNFWWGCWLPVFSTTFAGSRTTLSGLWQDVLIVCLAKHLQGHTGTAECGEINRLSKCFLKKGLRMETITISEIFF